MNKYNAKKTVYNGELYDSKAEASFAAKLDIARKAKEASERVVEIERQPKFPIEIEGENDMPMVRKAQFFEFQQRKTEALNQYKKTLEKFPNSEYAQKKILELTK